MAGQVTRRRGESFWREIIERQADTGLSIRPFCRRTRVHESAFCFRRRELRQRDSKRQGSPESSQSPAFVAVHVAQHEPAATAILDRFLHHAEIITLTGRSYRLNDRAEQPKTTATLNSKKQTARTAGIREDGKTSCPTQ